MPDINVRHFTQRDIYLSFPWPTLSALPFPFEITLFSEAEEKTTAQIFDNHGYVHETVEERPNLMTENPLLF